MIGVRSENSAGPPALGMAPGGYVLDDVPYGVGLALVGFGFAGDVVLVTMSPGLSGGKGT